jgi:acylaminoacyl-peptidase
VCETNSIREIQLTALRLAHIIGVLAWSAAAASFSPGDLWRWTAAESPQIDAGGERIVYIVRRPDRGSDSGIANLWMAAADGRERRQITEGPWRDRAPRWSPDGARLAWISDEGGPAHLRVFETASRRQRPIPGVDFEPLQFAWSPDGNSVAFTAKIPPEFNNNSWAPPAILGRLWRAEDPVRIFVVPVSGGAVRQVSSGAAEFRDPAWTADGRSILASNGQIWAFPIAGGAPRQLTTEGVNICPLPSPDGGKIAWLSTSSAPQSYAVRKLSVMNADGSRARTLTGRLDRDVADPQWSSDSRTVYFLADDQGATHVYAARNDGSVRQVTSAQERLHGFSLADSGRAVTVRSTASEPSSVVSLTVDRQTVPVKVAALGEDVLAEHVAGPVEEMRYESGGRTIQAWLVKPPGFDAGKKYPLLVEAADDPRRMYGYEFQLRAHILAASGSIVLCANPRGAPGYGEEFGNLIRTRYPGDDFDDLLRGVDAAIAKGYVDPQRLEIAGGLLAAWAIGHTDRFRKAVARRPIADWVTDVALATDGARRAANWMGAMPWDDPDQYAKRSPISYAQYFKTPTLVISADGDPESRQLFWALQQRKVPAEMVHFPAIMKPSDRVLELETILAWLAR